MIKPKTIGIQALAARWGCQPKQIIEAAIDGQIKLYFSLGNCTIADLPNPNPHNRLHERPYQGSLQADQPTLNDLLHSNEARHVDEAYTPEGAWVLVALPAQELSPQLGGHTMQTCIQITPQLNIKTADLHAFMEDVEACELDEYEAAPEVAHGTSKAAVVAYTKTALIDKYRHQWPTIVRDIASAGANGLAAAAKAGSRGWLEAEALNWARAKGKLISSGNPAASLGQAMHNMGNLPSRKHSLQG